MSHNPEPDQELLKIRHTAEHILHQAIKELFPQVQLAMGPATEEGFYNDFDPSPKGVTPVVVSETDFPQIEKRMRELIKLDLPLTRFELREKAARDLFKGNPYKLDWIDQIVKRGEKITVYWTGKPGEKYSMADLCSGPHAQSTGEVKAFKLISVAGAYWHGSEKNKMLTRIYGTAFRSEPELKAYLAQQAEAKKRDHRLLGKDLGLFAFSDLVGKGLPMLTAKGTTIRRELERFIVDEEIRRGYQHVLTPPLAKVDLYRTSGHYPYYKDTMYPPMVIDDEELILRPMTCPHHFMLYKSAPHSYREMPIRLAEISPQFRYEKSGELTGLIRVRMFMLADAHIMASKDQAPTEIKAVLSLIDFVNQTLGLKKGLDYRYRLSLGDRHDQKKYYQDNEAWDYAEGVLRDVLISQAAPYYEAPNEAAFYGPKIDVQMKNINGKEETAFTVQYDFVMPKRFELRFINSQGIEEEPIVIHRASLGCFERTMAFLIEKYAGAFPLWLSPIQVVVLPIGEDHVVYGKLVVEQFKAKNLRVELWDQAESLPKRIRTAEKQKTPYMVVVGDKEVASETVSIRIRGQKAPVVLTIDQFVTQAVRQVTTKALVLSLS